jgi:hypothetical protein
MPPGDLIDSSASTFVYPVITIRKRVDIFTKGTDYVKRSH